MTLNTIACAVDFSEPSRAAMAMAAGMARRYEARFVLLHVVSPPTAPMSDISISPVELSTLPFARPRGRSRGGAARPSLSQSLGPTAERESPDSSWDRSPSASSANASCPVLVMRRTERANGAESRSGGEPCASTKR
jgi:universal stress protein family protein